MEIMRILYLFYLAFVILELFQQCEDLLVIKHFEACGF